MATVHVLENAGGANFRCVLHVATPAGTNAVGTTWKTCYLATFLPGAPATVLSVGNGAGQISQNESNSIGAGDLMEFEFLFTDDPALDTAGRNALIDAVALYIKNQKLAELQARLKFYGYTRA
jgi:hypothetical protein